MLATQKLIHARCSKSNQKHSIRFCGIYLPSLKHNFIAYRSSKVSDCIFEIHQQWQSGFIRVYSKSCRSCTFQPEIIKIGHSSHKMYTNNILNFKESMTVSNAHTKKVWKLIVFHGAFQKLLERYNKFIAVGGDYFEVDLRFMCVL